MTQWSILQCTIFNIIRVPSCDVLSCVVVSEYVERVISYRAKSINTAIICVEPQLFTITNSAQWNIREFTCFVNLLFHEFGFMEEIPLYWYLTKTSQKSDNLAHQIALFLNNFQATKIPLIPLLTTLIEKRILSNGK